MAFIKTTTSESITPLPTEEAEAKTEAFAVRMAELAAAKLAKLGK